MKPTKYTGIAVAAVGIGAALYLHKGHEGHHPPYLLHPPVVHFPIALLTVGWAAGAMGRRFDWLYKTATGLLWLGTLSAWVAMGLGLLAAKTAPHVPLAWQTLNLHQTLAFCTVGTFTGLSILRWRLKERWPVWFLALWLGACGLVLATGYQGGELVFTHGMGVMME
ncbi:MAG: DUF2231 domain-containing protein [Elusimicrobia bacterium]|nr:DUF2231 domain-containing protein [Elusimicrobiota bacterium]